MNDKCEYRGCEENSVRHFFGRHFCDEHNVYLRQEAHRNQPDDLDEWIESHCRTSIERIIEQERDVLDALADE